MREFDIGLIHHSITHGGINLYMTEQFLHLLHRHPFINSHCCQCPTELMRVYPRDLKSPAKLTETDFDT